MQPHSSRLLSPSLKNAFCSRSTVIYRHRTSSRARGVKYSRDDAPYARPESFHAVPSLASWDVQTFRERAFIPELPTLLPQHVSLQPPLPASQSWFDNNDETHSSSRNLNYDYLSKFGDVIVPLELTRKDEAGKMSFERFDAPFSLFLDWMKQRRAEAEAQAQAQPAAQEAQTQPKAQPNLYLAQCPLPTLPAPLLASLPPTPSPVLHAGKGDIYTSSIWLGLSPTCTPLHRDPNPNFFLQLAGRKRIRLFPPQTGLALFRAVQQQQQQQQQRIALGHQDRGSHPVFRGEEMMQGPEREGLERMIWGDNDADEKYEDGGGGNDNGTADACVNQNGDPSTEAEGHYEAILDPGTALFIPLGWWHSVRSVGTTGTMTASVNWWFR